MARRLGAGPGAVSPGAAAAAAAVAHLRWSRGFASAATRRPQPGHPESHPALPVRGAQVRQAGRAAEPSHPQFPGHRSAARAPPPGLCQRSCSPSGPEAVPGGGTSILPRPPHPSLPAAGVPGLLSAS